MKLNLYAILACTWMAGVSQMQAIVLLTRLNPPTFATIPNSGEGTSRQHYLDLNADGTNDFSIVSSEGGMNCEALGTNEIACGIIFGAPQVGGFAQKIHTGAIIGVYQDSYNYDWTPGFGAMVGINGITSPPLISGYWGSNRDYLGVRFKIGDQTHYGWIQMYLPATEGRGYIEGFAYETTPDTAIIAGVPEPSITGLLGIGAASFLLRRRKKGRENTPDPPLESARGTR